MKHASDSHLQHHWVSLTDQGVEVSPQDDRNHRAVKLSNGLVAFISSDITHPKSAAALAVMVGASADPPQVPGLAHFCEHMCFLGSEKYPEENAYKKHLSAHGGRSNASTSSDRTVFQFDVAAEHLEDALDIFAQFFVAPLFTASATQREVEAVDSEDSKNRTIDGRRLLQVIRALASPSHTYSKFSTGNLTTLRDNLPAGLDVREAVLAFHRRHYVAPRMRLAVCGKASLDELEAWVRRGFSDVRTDPILSEESSLADMIAAGIVGTMPTAAGPPPIRAPFHSPFEQKDLPCFVKVEPMRELRELQLAWPMPSMEKHYRSDPLRLLSNLLGHEGQGSVFSVLQDRCWATALNAGTGHEDHHFSQFSVKVSMTPEGEAQWMKVVCLVMQYCALLQKLTSDEIRRHWNEKRAIAALAFRFQQKSPPYDFVQSVARNSSIREVEHILSGGHIFGELDAEQFIELAKRLTLENLMLRWVSHSLNGQSFNSEEKWYKVPFSREPLPKDVVEECSNMGETSSMCLPPPNEFIPDDLSLCGMVTEPALDSPVRTPAVLVSDSRGRLWHKIDERYAQPRVEIYFFLRSRVVRPNISTAGVFDSYLRHRLKQSTYAAALAGLSWSIGANNGGILLSVGGYSQRAPRLFSEVLQNFLQGPWHDEDAQSQTMRFGAVRERIERSLRNFDMERPDAHASYWASMLLAPEAPLTSERLDTITRLTLDDLKAFHAQFLASPVFAECFVIGNIPAERACELYEASWSQLVKAGIKPPSVEEDTDPPVVQLQPGHCFDLRGPVQNTKEENSGIYVYFQAGELTVPQQVHLRLITQIMKEPCFNELRTQQQIGYIVSSAHEVDYAGPRKVEGLSITIVSKKLSASEVLARIDEFIVGFRATLEAAGSPDLWNNHIESLCTKLLIPPKKLSEEASRHWHHIRRRALNWDWREQLVDALRKATCREAMEFFDELVSQASRRRVSSLIFGRAFPMPDLVEETTDAAKVLQIPGNDFLDTRTGLPRFTTCEK